MVLCIDEEDYAADFGEVVAPEAAGLGVAAEIEGGELYVADGEFFRGWGGLVGAGCGSLWGSILGWRATHG